MDELINQIFSISNESEFNACALKVFEFQRQNCDVYKAYLNHLNKPYPSVFYEIPFLPIRFFKSHEVVSFIGAPECVFKSSGTMQTGRSQHLIKSIKLYERSFIKTYEDFFGDSSNQIIIALLPNYLEQGESSLVYMVDTLIKRTKNNLSGFYLDNLLDCANALLLAKKTGQKVVLFGVSYALLDLAELNIDLSGIRIIETGGMKGRREEWSKQKLHSTLKKAFNVDYISSEYGMTELLSQAYSDKNGVFECPNYLRILLRETNDPFSQIQENNKTGGINVIDLANLYSCAFIETQDLGRLIGTKFQLLGRFDNSDIRGCNLLLNNFDVA